MKTVYTLLLVAAFIASVGCGYSKMSSAPVAGTMPAIATLSPDTASAGGGAFTLTVNGSNFGSKAVVNWNGAAQTTTFVSGSQLTIAVPAMAISASGSVQVTVTNPGTPGNGMYGGGTLPETSMPMSFMIN